MTEAIVVQHINAGASKVVLRWPNMLNKESSILLGSWKMFLRIPKNRDDSTEDGCNSFSWHSCMSATDGPLSSSSKFIKASKRFGENQVPMVTVGSLAQLPLPRILSELKESDAAFQKSYWTWWMNGSGPGSLKPEDCIMQLSRPCPSLPSKGGVPQGFSKFSGLVDQLKHFQQRI